MKKRRRYEEEDELEPPRGGLILGLAILSLFVWPLSVVALHMASKDKNKMAAGTMDDSDSGLTTLGIVIATIPFCGCVVFVAAAAVYFLSR